MESQNSKTIKQVLLKDLGNKLPIEIKDKKDQSFTFRDWTMEEEKEIAKIKDKNPSMGRFISAVLCLMIKTMWGEDFEAQKDNEKILVINQLPVGDVFYLYIYLRFDQLGDELALDFKCPFCGKPIKDFIATLKDIDIDCKFGDYEEIVSYKLRKPITLEKGQQLVEELKLGIAKWDLMEKADTQESGDEAAMKEHTFKNSIVGVAGMESFIQTDEIIKKMKKIDIEFLQKAIAEHNAGPNIQAEITCSTCKQSFWRNIDWGYDSFFGIGSLPQA